jgi:hypothetical protein
MYHIDQFDAPRRVAQFADAHGYIPESGDDWRQMHYDDAIDYQDALDYIEELAKRIEDLETLRGMSTEDYFVDAQLDVLRDDLGHQVEEAESMAEMLDLWWIGFRAEAIRATHRPAEYKRFDCGCQGEPYVVVDKMLVTCPCAM